MGAAVAVFSAAVVAVALIWAGGVAANLYELGVLLFGENLTHFGVIFLEGGFVLGFLFFLGKFLILVDGFCECFPFFMGGAEFGELFFAQVELFS